MMRLPPRLRSMEVLTDPPGIGGFAAPRPARTLARLRSRRLFARLRAMRRRNKLVLAVAVPLVGLLGWMLLRDSPLFSIDQVQVFGLSPQAAPVVEADLLAAARGETTTDFSLGALRAAVAPYTLIAGVRAQTEFPHGLRIEVRERAVLAHLQVGARWFLLDPSGEVLTGARAAEPVATLRSRQLPRAGYTHDAFVRMALRLLADAPAPLRARVVAVTAPHGLLTVYLHRGPRLIFGNAALAHAKWDALAAVLADPASRGASYVDVQVPSRPAAQVADPATTGLSPDGSVQNAPSGASGVSTLLDPSLVQPSSYTSG